jgi:hypothetical protein
VEDGEPADGVGDRGGPAVVVLVEVELPVADVPLPVPAGALLRGERPRLVVVVDERVEVAVLAPSMSWTAKSGMRLFDRW